VRSSPGLGVSLIAARCRLLRSRATLVRPHPPPVAGRLERERWPSRPLSATSALRPALDHQDDRQGYEDANDDPNRAAKDGTGSEADQGGDEVSPVTRHPFTSSGLRGTFLNAGPSDGPRAAVGHVCPANRPLAVCRQCPHVPARALADVPVSYPVVRCTG
jgi:hypothetical protein